MLPDIHAMGASSGHKDLFVEIGAMTADPLTAYGKDPVTNYQAPHVLSLLVQVLKSR